MNEERLVGWLRSRPGTGALGDDCAFLSLADGPWAVTVDTQTAGVHVPAGMAEDVLARRLLAVSLSDLAAVGARPAHAFLTLSAPADFAYRSFFEAFLDASVGLGIELSGGDVAGCDRYAATLTLLGRRAEGADRFVRRSDARPGDRLWLGGPVGRSHLGLCLTENGARCHGREINGLPAVPPTLVGAARRAVRCHQEPLAEVITQLRLGGELARRARSAALDVSDGLAKDLHRLCAESGVGAVLSADAVRLADEDAQLADYLAADPLQAALGGGEDYVLLFALPPEEEAPAGSRAIGRITSGVVEIERNGRRQALPAMGFDHFSR